VQTPWHSSKQPRHDAIVAALHEPAAYADGAASIDVVETHRAWVFMTKALAYKLAKAPAHRRHDAASLELRRRSCQRELALNQRLGGDVYRGVVPVAQLRHGYRVEAHGPAVEWLIAMRRLPRGAMLDVAIAERQVHVEQVDALADALLTFYAQGARAPTTGVAYRRRLLDDIEAKRAALAQARYGIDPSGSDRLAALLRAWVASHAAELESRAGTIVDAHGDLRPEHVCLEPRPVIIDCLEFDRELRLLDPASELSFLALECRRLGAAWIGSRLLSHFGLRLGPIPSELERFYEGYHALVRAAVAIWHLDDRTQRQHARWRARTAQYLRLGLDEAEALAPRRAVEPDLASSTSEAIQATGE